MLNLYQRTGVFVFTAPVLEGYEIEEYYGMVSGTVIYGANFIKDFFARVRDTVGGRTRGYEATMNSAVEGAVEQMVKKAAKHGANAVIAAQVTTGAMSVRLLMASAHGTAVRLRPIANSTTGASPE